jgi:hypothetical protein
MCKYSKIQCFPQSGTFLLPSIYNILHYTLRMHSLGSGAGALGKQERHHLGHAHSQPFCNYLVFQVGSHTNFSWLSLQLWSSCLCLPRSWNYRWAPLHWLSQAFLNKSYSTCMSVVFFWNSETEQLSGLVGNISLEGNFFKGKLFPPSETCKNKYGFSVQSEVIQWDS